MFRLPVSGIDVELRLATGADDLLFLEGGGDTLSTSIALAGRLARQCDGRELDAAGLAVPDLEALLLEVRRELFGDEVSSRGQCLELGCGAPVDISFRIGDYLSHARARMPANV